MLTFVNLKTNRQGLDKVRDLTKPHLMDYTVLENLTKHDLYSLIVVVLLRNVEVCHLTYAKN